MGWGVDLFYFELYAYQPFDQLTISNYEKVILNSLNLQIEVDKNSLQMLWRVTFISPDEHYAIASLQIDNDLLTVKAKLLMWVHSRKR